MSEYLTHETLAVVRKYLEEMSGKPFRPTGEEVQGTGESAIPLQIAYELGMAEAYRILASHTLPNQDMKKIRRLTDVTPGGLDAYRKGLSAAKAAVKEARRPETERVTVHFAGAVTYDAAKEDRDGKPYPTTPDGHAKLMAERIALTINEALTYEEDDLEPGDYVQEIHGVTVTGATEEETDRRARLEELVAKAAELFGKFEDRVEPLVDSNGDPSLRTVQEYDSIKGDFETDGWELIEALAMLSKPTD